MGESSQFVGREQAGVRVAWNVQVPLRDAVRLSAIAYLPRNQVAPSPAVLTLTPYVAQTFHDRGMFFAAHGYPFIAVDVRGRGNSQGSFRPLVNEARDAFDVVEWLARQPYCDGRVAMWGGSYGGFVQWGAAKEFPPHLATIVPVATPYAFLDFPCRNNIPLTYWMQWLTFVAGRTSQDKTYWNNEFYWGEKFREWMESGAAFKDLDSLLGLPSEIFQEWVSHPRPDAYWDSCNPTSEQYSRISIPILTITGCYDNNQPGALAHYQEHMRNATAEARSRHYLVIGPWDHAGTRTPQTKFAGIEVGTASLIDLPKLHTDWYAWTMQGGSRPEFLKNKVAYYVMGTDMWRYVDTLEAVTARVEALYLASESNPTDVFASGMLKMEPPHRSEPDHYVYDPRDVSLAPLESTVDPDTRADHRMVYAAVGKQLVYHSAPFQQDTEVCGFFRLALWMSIDQPDTDFRASIYEVCLDGSTIELSTQRMRARYREGLREQKLVRTSEPLRYDFESFPFISRSIAKHHRLRLVIGPVNSIIYQKNHNSGGVVAEESILDAQTVTVRLFHDESHPSALYVPLGQTKT